MTWTNDLRIRADVAPSVASQQGAVAYRVNRTVSQSQIVPIAGFQRPKWAAMATNPNAPGMMATGYKIALHSATHYKVTVTYSYPSGDTNEDEDGNPINPDNPDNPNDAKEKYKVKISDRSNMTLEPILSYYKLRNTDGSSKYPENDMLILAVYLSGGLVLCSNRPVPAEMRERRDAGAYSTPRHPDHPVYHTWLQKNIAEQYGHHENLYSAPRRRVQGGTCGKDCPGQRVWRRNGSTRV